MTERTETINHPPHYNRGKIEVIDFIDDQGLDFYRGNVVKYICREGKLGVSVVDDLKKARWYLDRLISKLEIPGPPNKSPFVTIPPPDYVGASKLIKTEPTIFRSPHDVTHIQGPEDAEISIHKPCTCPLCFFKMGERLPSLTPEKYSPATPGTTWGHTRSGQGQEAKN